MNVACARDGRDDGSVGVSRPPTFILEVIQHLPAGFSASSPALSSPALDAFRRLGLLHLRQDSFLISIAVDASTASAVTRS
jgi:hypothetical protein